MPFSARGTRALPEARRLIGQITVPDHLGSRLSNQPDNIKPDDLSEPNQLDYIDAPLRAFDLGYD